MLKRPLKKSPRKKTANKAAKKPAARKTKKASAPPRENKRGFMWKLLERKQAELKRMVSSQPKHPFAHHDEKPHNGHAAPQGHARFAGPRRKAA